MHLTIHYTVVLEVCILYRRLQCLSHRNDAAVEVAQQLLNSLPNIADSWLCVGNVWCDMNSPTKAMETYNSAIVSCPFSPVLHHALVQLQLQQVCVWRLCTHEDTEKESS